MRPIITRLSWPLLLPILFAPACIHGQQLKPGPFCRSLATDVVNDSRIANTVTSVVNNPSCFVEAAHSSLDTQHLLEPLRAPLWTALGRFANAQQQGSNVSSSSSTNAVSKPSGSTSLVEEFGGFTVSSGTSSLTLQVAPGQSLTDLAMDGVINICDKLVVANCWNPGVIKALMPLTVKITANTSTGAQSLKGTATSPAAPSTSQQAIFSSLGSSLPTFAGLTIQYGIVNSKPSSAVTQDTTSTIKVASGAAQYLDELAKANAAADDLSNCSVYATWKSQADETINKSLDANRSRSLEERSTALASDITGLYQHLAQQMFSAPDCLTAGTSFNKLLEAMLAAEAYEDFGAVKAASNVPALSLEYDLNTPQNQLAYSSVKASGTLQFGRKPANAAKNKADSVHASKKLGGALDTYVKSAVASLVAPPPATQPLTKSPCGSNSMFSPPPAAKITRAASAAAAAATPPFSLSAMLDADLYNSVPPSTVPSTSQLRDVQAGAEIDYRFDLKPGCGLQSLIANWFGSITAAGAYYYQDQTSNNILTGPPSSITFTGLPAGTSSVYAKRGVINLAQLRLGFGTGSKATFPVAATYSNRTELVAHPTWGLQFGLSYNLNSLFSRQ
jgi:hypothetical protein